MTNERAPRIGPSQVRALGEVLGQPKAAESTRRVRRDRTSAGFKSEFAVRVAKYPPFDVLGGPPRGVWRVAMRKSARRDAEVTNAERRVLRDLGAASPASRRKR